MAILVAGLLVAYLWRFEPEIWHRNRSVLLFFLGLVVTALVMRIAADRALWAFVVPTSATVLLIGILLGSGAGAAMAAGLAVLAGIMNRDALDLAVYVLAGGAASLLVLARAERLNAFVRVFAGLFLTNLVVVTAFSLLGARDLTGIAQLWAASFGNALLSVVLAIGSFWVLGNLFGIMTVFQLLELANPSNRLLRRLLLETPGTYHHSVMVGNLAERAAETIGADPLLARVAAYYHDIGKMKNPLAFIENQAGARNIHDDLVAETSARIIAGHIRDGIDLGYEHGLPVQIIGFIPQHHGTAVMSYFHDKALREVGGRETRRRADYRYPGPKPQSREAAIIMLADGVEASVRSLDEKDPETIRAMVDRIVDARVEDGQLDDAELTLKNIAQIKEAFVEQLLGMYHSRIKYPDNVVPMESRRAGLILCLESGRPRRLGWAQHGLHGHRPRPGRSRSPRQGGRADAPAAALDLLESAVCETVHAALGTSDAEVELTLAGDQEMERLNFDHMGERGPTDVLSFPLHEWALNGRNSHLSEDDGISPPGPILLGDVVIDLDQALRQAAEGDWGVVEELVLLAIHGTLHLVGHDHAELDEETRMRDLERRSSPPSIAATATCLAARITLRPRRPRGDHRILTRRTRPARAGRVPGGELSVVRRERVPPQSAPPWAGPCGCDRGRRSRPPPGSRTSRVLR